MLRLWRALLVAVLVLGVAAPSASAAPDKKTLSDLLGAVWEVTLEAPIDENPFGGGDPCVDLGGGIVAPLAPLGTGSLTCTVAAGTRIFVVAESSECSTVEDPPFFGRNPGQLRKCARTADAGFQVPTVTVDGTPVDVTEVETRVLSLTLPADNILGAPPGEALSVAHGWVALLDPLAPGTHTIVIHNIGTDAFGNPIDFTNTTTIIAQPA